MGETKVYLDAETDEMLRSYIVGLADKCIAANYEGTECRLATFLAEFIYHCSPVDLRPKALSAGHAAICGLPEGTIV